MKTLRTLVALSVVPFPAVATAEPNALFIEYGTSISVGGGLVQFVNNDTRDFATEGAGWEARIAFGTRKAFAIEVGYLGSLHRIDALGLDSKANLLGTNVEGALRVNVAQGRIQPYLLAGAGYAHYNLTSFDANTSDVGDRDNVTVFPFGAGVGVKEGGLMFDARAVYRATSNVDMFAGTNTSLDSWSATLRVGFEY